MTDIGSSLADRAAELRDAFDRAFAEPAHLDETPREDLLAVHAGGEAYAIRLAEISGVFTDKKITPVPGRNSALVGIAGFRGAIMPVYSLGFLFGHANVGPQRWLMLASSLSAALSFDRFEGHLRVARDDIVARPAGERAVACVRDFARHSGVIYPIVNLRMALDAIRATTPDPNAPKER